MLIDYKLNQFIVSFKYDPETVLAVKTLPERKYDKDRHIWIIPGVHKNEILKFGTNYDFTFTTSAKDALNGKQSSDKNTPQENLVIESKVKTLEAITPELPDLLLINGDFSLPVESGKTPFPHQIEVAKLAMWRRKSIIKGDMGTGKTMAALLAARNIGNPNIVVCPASLIDNWKREADIVGVRLDGVWSYGKMPDEYPTPYTLLADEAHAFQNPSSQRGKKFLKLAKHADAVMSITGTPIKNGKPVNVMPLLMAAEHETVKDLSHYQIHYCNARKTPWSRWDCSGARNLTELHARTKDVMFGKKKEECLNLPEKIRQKVKVNVADQTKYHEEINELIRQFNIAIPDPMAMTRQQAVGFMMKARRLASIQKVAGACEVIDEILEQGGKVVVFTAFIDSAKMLAEKYSKQSLLLIGETNVGSRQGLVDRFQTDPTKRIFVSTFGAGGVGITLTVATNVILVDRTFVPADADQAESRLHRLGATGTVLCSWLQLDELDEKIDKILESKEENIELIMDGKRKTLNRNSAESIALAFMPSIFNKGG